jgi:hypothetical protein
MPDSLHDAASEVQRLQSAVLNVKRQIDLGYIDQVHFLVQDSARMYRVPEWQLSEALARVDPEYRCIHEERERREENRYRRGARYRGSWR